MEYRSPKTNLFSARVHTRAIGGELVPRLFALRASTKLLLIFSLAIKYGITHSNPGRDIPWLPENNKRVCYLLDKEEPKLFAILNGRRKQLRPLVTIAIGTGMRRGD